jgi:hypothetical protein
MMRRRVAIASLVWAGLVVASTPAPAQTNPCATVGILLRERQLDDARAAYLLLRQRPGSRTCAAAGIKRVDQLQKEAAALVKQADAARTRGGASDRDLAINLYRQALARDANAAGARAGLAAALQPVTPVPTPVEEDTSLPDRAKDKGESLISDLTSYGTWLAGWLAWGAAIALAALLLVRLIRWLFVSNGPERTFRPRLTIAEFDAADDTSEGKDAALMLAAHLRGTAERPRTSLDQQANTAATDDVFNDLTTALKSFGPGAIAATLLNLIRSLIPRTTLTVQGRVVTADDGVGLALSLVEGGGQVVRAVVLKQRDYGPEYAADDEDKQQDAANRRGALERLTGAGAVWLQHMVVDLGHGSEGAGWSSADWQSDAFFEAALLARHEGPDAQQELYAAALDRDPQNRAAAFNVAVLESREGAWARAARRLAEIAAAERTDAALHGELAVLWFQATYHQAVVALRDGDAVATYPYARSLVRELATAVPAAKPEPVPEDRPMTGTRRERTEVRELAAEVAALSEPDNATLPDRQRLLRIRERANRLLYTGPDALGEGDDRNAQLRRIEAPALALLGDVLLVFSRREGDEKEQWPDDWRDALAKAIEDKHVENVDLRPSSVIDLLEDPPRGAPELRVWRSVRSDYNLACYYARLAEVVQNTERRDRAVATSLGWLAAARYSKRLREWAKRDPSFAWLRQHRPAGFWEVIGDRDYAGELASLRAIGATLAATLAERFEISTPADLVDYVERNGTGQLARDLGLPQVLVDRWVGLAKICSIEGVTIEQANLLDDADVQTPRQLATMTETDLHTLLENAADDQVDVPQPYQLARWIAAAKEIAAREPGRSVAAE